MTIQRFVEAAGRGDLETVRSMVAARPELVHLDVAENDEHRALHHAVLQRRPEVVRFLMQMGADARKGIWPHRGATTAFTIAGDRGYDEIVAIIKDEESRRAGASELQAPPPAPAPVERSPDTRARDAIASGDADWLRARHAEGVLGNGDGLVSDAVAVARPDMLMLLLDLGLDPDESGRVEGLDEVVPTWGQPLRACAIAGNVTMAEMLLRHGANPNTSVYASSDAMHEAYKRRDEPMKVLLERHGGRLGAGAVAELGLVEDAARLLAEDAGKRATERVTGPHSSVVQDLLWGAIDCPSPEIVRLALGATDWLPDDRRWHGILENGLYRSGTGDRLRHLEAFRLILERSDPDVRSRRGTTLVHEVAASRGGLTAEDRIAYTSLLLDRGARVDIRDDLLRSTPLGWACRWGRVEMVKMLIERGADPLESDAEPWATPLAWATKKGHAEIAALLTRG